MKITDIVQKIENPNLCTASDVQDFEGLIEKYPYAQSFPILLLKTLGQSKDIHFEDSLNKHAYRVSDRMHLYFLINDISSEEVTSSELRVTSSDDQDVNVEEVALKSVEEVVENVSSSKLQVESSAVEEEVESADLQVEDVASSGYQDEELEKVEGSIDEEEDIVRLDYEKLLEQDIKFEKVEEMTFEPVRIHVDDNGEVSSINDEEIITNTPLQEVSDEFFEVDEVPSITIEEEIKAESADVEVSAEELQETNQEIDKVEEISAITLEEEIDAERADVEVSAEELNEANQEKFEVEEIISSTDQDEEDLSFGDSENVSIEFFDPTQEMETSNAVEDISILKPSSFEEQHKTISLDFIEKKFNQEEDELTSNAIAQGFQITFESEEVASSVDQDGGGSEVDEKDNISESIKKFEQTSSDEKRSFYSWLHANEESFNPEKNDRSTEIIEKFIQEEPKITRSVKEDEEIEKKKTPFFKATEIAKESLKEKSIPVSVTLAQIFESQGNFPKAIDSYEQLMLLYPEKKTFFANQIKKLKKKLNN